MMLTLGPIHRHSAPFGRGHHHHHGHHHHFPHDHHHHPGCHSSPFGFQSGNCSSNERPPAPPFGFNCEMARSPFARGGMRPGFGCGGGRGGPRHSPSFGFGFERSFPPSFGIGGDHPFHRHCGPEAFGTGKEETLEKNSETKFQIEIDVKGFKAEDMDVKVIGNLVVVKGHHVEKQEGELNVSREFVTKYELPEGIKLDTVACTLLSREGLLRISAERVAPPPEMGTTDVEMETSIPVNFVGQSETATGVGDGVEDANQGIFGETQPGTSRRI